MIPTDKIRLTPSGVHYVRTFDNGQEIEVASGDGGLYWRVLPDGEPVGPFATADEADQDAEDQATEKALTFDFDAVRRSLKRTIARTIDTILG